MKLIEWAIAGGVAACLVASGPARAQSGLDSDILKLYGGSYSSDCANAAAARLRVTARELVVEQGNKRLVGNNAQAAHSFFGRSAPPHYQVALLSEVRGGSQMLFIVYRDHRGLYISLDGDQRVTAALGKTLMAQPFYRCDGEQRQAAAPTPAPPPAPQAASEPQSPPDLLRDTAFRSAYIHALGPKAKENWLRTLEGPAPQLKRVRVAGMEYVLASVCKAHDCADNNTVLLYSRENGKVYGKVFDRRRATLIGEPPAAIAAELDRLWASEWKRK